MSLSHERPVEQGHVLQVSSIRLFSFLQIFLNHARMLPFRKKSKTVAEVHLSPNVESTCNAKQPNVWLSNEDICGCAVFSLPVGVAFSHSKVALRGKIDQLNGQYGYLANKVTGTVIVKTDQNAGASSLQRSWRTEKLSVSCTIALRESRLQRLIFPVSGCIS